MKLSALCVYCGSNPGHNPQYLQTASAFGSLIASKGITLVYGGGRVGLMGAVADGALRNGGRVIGVIPKLLFDKEVAHKGLTELHVVASMHERKTTMAQLSDAFVALPGGIGTLEEIFEVYTWTQLGFHQKPCALLNCGGYYDGLITFICTMVESGFLKKEHLESLLLETDMSHLLAKLMAYEHRHMDKWTELSGLKNT